MFDPAQLSPDLAAGADALAARIEEAGLNAAQPPEQLLYDGWLLRLSPGKARRARSVNAIADGRLELQQRIDRCRALYARAGLPCLFRITPFSRPAGLDQVLGRLGFAAEDETRVMSMRLDAVAKPAPREREWREIGVTEFAQLAGDLRRSSAQQVAAHAARLEAAPPLLKACRLALIENGSVVAIGQSVQEFDLVGLYDIATAAQARNRGLATALASALLWRAAAEGAALAYLQVSADNIAARQVYRRLGFVDRYVYWYRVDPGLHRSPPA